MFKWIQFVYGWKVFWIMNSNEIKFLCMCVCVSLSVCLCEFMYVFALFFRYRPFGDRIVFFLQFSYFKYWKRKKICADEFIISLTLFVSEIIDIWTTKNHPFSHSSFAFLLQILLFFFRLLKASKTFKMHDRLCGFSFGFILEQR